jgi:hypothetical protein
MAGYVVGRAATPGAADGIILIPAAVLALTALGSFQIVRRLERESSAAREPAERPWEAFLRELDRSRRFERSFVLLRAPIPSVSSGGNRAAEQARLRALLSIVVRSIDHVWFDDQGVFVLLAESTRASAMAAVVRLSAAVPQVIALDSVEMAEFPDDGLTTGALLANLRPIAADDAKLVRLPAPGEARRGTERTG